MLTGTRTHGSKAFYKSANIPCVLDLNFEFSSYLSKCLFVVNAFLLGKHFTIFININVTALICFLGEGHVSLPSWCGQISLGSMGSTLLAFFFSAKCSNVFCKVFIYLFF